MYINNEICKLPVYCIPYSYKSAIPKGFIEAYVPEVPCYFDGWEYVDNYDYKWYQKRIGEISNEINTILAAKSDNLSADICKLTDLEKNLQHMKLVIQSIPEKKWVNFGASIIKIVKQEDYDNQRGHKAVKKLSEQQRVRHHTK